MALIFTVRTIVAVITNALSFITEPYTITVVFTRTISTDRFKRSTENSYIVADIICPAVYTIENFITYKNSVVISVAIDLVASTRTFTRKVSLIVIIVHLRVQAPAVFTNCVIIVVHPIALFRWSAIAIVVSQVDRAVVHNF